MPNYRVVYHESIGKEYLIPNCRTAEEAESIAQDLYEDGEGTVSYTEIVAIDTEQLEDEE